MRNFIIATNVELDIENIIEMNIDDLSIIFNEDTLNVLSPRQYKQLLESTYLYGLRIDVSNYLIDYRKFLNMLVTKDPTILCIFDASIKRYINNSELVYFANNKLLPSKLFNIEINAGENQCIYKTIGLESLGLNEFKLTVNKYLNEEDFQTFKSIVTHYIIGKNAKIVINGKTLEYKLSDYDGNINITYQMPDKIYEFYKKDDAYLNDIRYTMIRHNYKFFQQMYLNKIIDGDFLINKSAVNDIENFDVRHVEEFDILTPDMNYNYENLFYAMRYIK